MNGPNAERLAQFANSRPRLKPGASFTIRWPTTAWNAPIDGAVGAPERLSLTRSSAEPSLDPNDGGVACRAGPQVPRAHRHVVPGRRGLSPQRHFSCDDRGKRPSYPVTAAREVHGPLSTAAGTLILVKVSSSYFAECAAVAEEEV
jgi:hypothetical protein